MLAVSTESWHFAYYKWLRGLYGYSVVSDRTSLCPYCQTILWGSIFCLICFPLLITGWLSMRIGRWVMKLDGPWADKLISKLDNSTVGTFYEKGPTNFEKSPFASGVLYTLMGSGAIIGISAILGVVLLIIGGLGYGAWNIVSIIEFFGTALSEFGLYIGWGLFQVTATVGFCMNQIGLGCLWLFTNKELWTFIGTWTLLIVEILAAVAVVCIIVGYLTMKIARTEYAQKIWASFVTRINGFGAKKKARQDRIEAAKKAAFKGLPDVICLWCHRENTADRNICHYCDQALSVAEPSFLLFSIFGWVFTPFAALWGRVHKFGKEEVHLLGWVGIIWEFIKALKKGVCPIVEFTTPAKLQSRAVVDPNEQTSRKRNDNGIDTD